MQTINNRQALLAFSYFAKIGPAKLIILEKYFPDFVGAFWANAYELERVGINSKITSEFINWRKDFDLLKIEAEMEKEKIGYITWQDNDYPELLKEISSPPFVLYYRGSLDILSARNINRLAIVGSRKHSSYGEKVISELMPNLIANGLEIISGLALGIDSLAHRATLDNNGVTIAVLGTGVDSASLYPPINKRLANDIIANNGLIISEFPPKTAALPQHFPQRNRIISGLAQATLIIEAKERSGSLITANFALDQNREVLAVPGNIFSEYSGGTNGLIKAGAKVITRAEDILDVYKIDYEKDSVSKKSHLKTKVTLENEVEKKIYTILKQAHERAEKITTDEIIKLTKLDTAVINSTLSILELRGVAKSDGISYDIN